MLSACLISDHHTNFFKSCHDLSPRGNEILMHIHLRHGLMDDTRRSSWHQCSMLLFRMAVSYALLHASIVWFLPDVLVFCVRRLSRRLRQSCSHGAHSRPEQRPQVLLLIFFFFVHIANIPEELREDHLHGHASAHRHFSGRGVEGVPAVYIKPLAGDFLLKTKIISGFIRRSY